MDSILQVLLIYFAVGFVALCVLECFTHRITSKLYLAGLETQKKMAFAGSYAGYRTAMALTVLALVLLWPAAIYGALTPKEDDSDG